MTLKTMRDLVRTKLRRYTDLSWADAEINSYLNEAQSQFCVRTKYCRKHGTVTITADTGIQTLPTDNLCIYRAEWDGSIVDIRTTTEMDMMYTGDWRDTTGSIIEAIIQDYEEEGKFRIYPILSATDIGTTTLKLDYAYLLSDITTESGSSSLPSRYHVALVEFAVYRCLEANVQSDQNPIMGDRYYDRFMDYVNAARSEMDKGKGSVGNRRVIGRSFI